MNKLIYLHIDSRHRDHGTATNFSYSIDPSIRDVKKLAIVSLELPYTIYPVRAINSTINWTDSGPVARSAVITSGYYTGSSLATQIASQMTSTSATDTYTGSFSLNTFKITIIESGALTWSMTMGTNITSSIRFVTGFTTDTTTAASHTGNNVVRTTGESNVYIRVSSLPDLSYIGTGSEGGSTTQSARLTNLFKIPIDANPGDVINYTNPNDIINTYMFQNHANINNFQISLEFYDGEILELNGSEWSLTLSLLT